MALLITLIIMLPISAMAFYLMYLKYKLIKSLGIRAYGIIPPPITDLMDRIESHEKAKHANTRP